MGMEPTIRAEFLVSAFSDTHVHESNVGVDRQVDFG
jgi:hypothetical protein